MTGKTYHWEITKSRKILLCYCYYYYYNR